MFRFHQWRIYHEARQFRIEIEKNVLPKLSGSERYALVDQLRRAGTSIALNIAEGSFRRSEKDLARFMNQALSSLYEVVSCFDLAYDSGYLRKNEIDVLQQRAEDLARQIMAFIKKLH